jgi:hypothetical protein
MRHLVATTTLQGPLLRKEKEMLIIQRSVNLETISYTKIQNISIKPPKNGPNLYDVEHVLISAQDGTDVFEKENFRLTHNRQEGHLELERKVLEWLKKNSKAYQC